jgi:hypothetical protein
MYNKHIDPAQTGRNLSSTKGVDRIVLFCKTLQNLNGPKTADVAVIYDRLSKGNSAPSLKTGNKMAWRFTYMIHRRGVLCFQ